MVGGLAKGEGKGAALQTGGEVRNGIAQEHAGEILGDENLGGGFHEMTPLSVVLERKRPN